MSSKKTILVTGGAGFIGSHLCERLEKDGHKVISLDNYFAGSKENHVSGVEYREGHTKNIESLVPEKIDLIYHLGEYSRVEQSLLESEVVHDLNVIGTRGVLDFWKKSGCKLVYAGSSTKFGDKGNAREVTPYASTKAKNTESVKEIGDSNKIPYAITYFYNVYGQGERAGIYGTVIETFKQMYLSGAPITVVKPGTQTRNFTHVLDIVEGLVLVGEKGEGDEYGLGNEKAYSISEIAKMFGGEILLLPERKGNRMMSDLDTTKTFVLGWKPQYSLEKYIGDFVKMHKRGVKKEKRVLVFSTTFLPTTGPAEEALIELVNKMPDVQFDIVTTCFSPEAAAKTTHGKNVSIHRIGFGHKSDKYLLPFLGYKRAKKLHAEHNYLFTWSIMASYAGLAGIFLRRKTKLPLLITLADQQIENVSGFIKTTLKLILSDADQVYGAGHQEEQVRQLTNKQLRKSIGEGDAFANQLRYSYSEILLNQKR